jgi:hypothetical protein
MVNWEVNVELTYIKVVSKHMTERIRENHKILSQNSRPQSRESKREIPE